MCQNNQAEIIIAELFASKESCWWNCIKKNLIQTYANSNACYECPLSFSGLQVACSQVRSTWFGSHRSNPRWQGFMIRDWLPNNLLLQWLEALGKITPSTLSVLSNFEFGFYSVNLCKLSSFQWWQGFMIRDWLPNNLLLQWLEALGRSHQAHFEFSQILSLVEFVYFRAGF